MLKIILAPIIGGIIGYITNDIAIKMLFHPYKPIYIGKWHVPLTPGLIPSQKGRFAHAIGQMVSNQLLNSETLLKEALADSVIEGIRAQIYEKFDALGKEERTLHEIVCEHVPEEEIAAVEQKIVEQGGAYLSQRIIEAKLGDLVAEQLRDELSRSVRLPFPFDVSSVLSPIRQGLSTAVNHCVEKYAPDMIEEQIRKAEDDLLNRPVSEVMASYMGKKEELADTVVRLYRTLINNYLSEILEAVKIHEIVERKLLSFHAADLEKLLFGIMKRELKAIVYLGAILGALMGFINLLY